MSVIYEVNVSVNADAYDEYHTWLMQHIKDILKIDGFSHAEVFSRKIEDEATNPDGSAPDATKKLLTVQYHVKDRADGQKHFGGRFTAQRRILASLHKINL